MHRLTHKLDQLLYPGVSDNWDNALLRQVILDQLFADACVLDLGAGAGRIPEFDFRDRARRVVGVDPDPAVLENPYLTEACIGTGAAIPCDDATFDVVICNNLLEHLARPAAVFAEIARVLKPGGRFVFKTPNKRHYVALAATLTPHRFHQWFNAKRGRPAEHTFATHYRANTPAEIRALAGASGLTIDEIRLVESRPEYLRLTPPTYLLGWLYERAVNQLPGADHFRAVMIVVGKRVTE